MTSPPAIITLYDRLSPFKRGQPVTAATFEVVEGEGKNTIYVSLRRDPNGSGALRNEYEISIPIDVLNQATGQAPLRITDIRPGHGNQGEFWVGNSEVREIWL
jgi:hypothetical protein